MLARYTFGMNPRTSGIFIGLIVVAMFVTGAVAFPHLPAIVPAYANRTTGAGEQRLWVVLILPLMAAAFWGLWALLPGIDPIVPGFKGFRYAYDFFWILLIALLALVYATQLGDSFGWTLTPARVALPGAGVLLLSLGAILPRIRRNWFFGVRTPWTLSSDTVWNRTNRVGAWLFACAGVVSLAGSFIAGSSLWWYLAAPVLSAAIASAVYSYVLYARG